MNPGRNSARNGTRSCSWLMFHVLALALCVSLVLLTCFYGQNHTGTRPLGVVYNFGDTPYCAHVQCTVYSVIVMSDVQCAVCLSCPMYSVVSLSCTVYCAQCHCHV